MQRTKVKGTGARKPSQPDSEPDFYAMSFVVEKEKKTAMAPAAIGSPTASVIVPSVAAMSPSSWRPSPTVLSPGQALLSEKIMHDSLTRSGLMGMRGAGNTTGGGSTRSSFLGPAALPTASEREIMAQMIAASSRLQNLREASGLGHFSFGGSSTTKSSSAGLLNQATGPLHLNAFNMACNCSIPAF